MALLDVVVGSRADAVFLVFEYCEYDLARSIDSMAQQGHLTFAQASQLKMLQRMQEKLLLEAHAAPEPTPPPAPPAAPPPSL